MSTRAVSSDKPVTARKAKAVHKVLKEDAFRQATEASWTKHSSEVQSLDVLTRCKKLNQFLAQGLLGEVDDGVLEALSQSAPARPAAVQRALAITLQKPQQGRPQRQSPEHENGRETASSPSRQPLTSRITAKETAALLELLGEEEKPQQAGTHPNPPVSSTGPSNHLQEAVLQTGPQTTQAAIAAADDDLDIIGLINQPAAAVSTSSVEGAVVADFRSVLQQLRQEQTEQAALCLQCAFRCKHARQLLQDMKQQAKDLQQQLHHLLIEQPQQRPLASGGVSQAWDGCYKYWGPHAACTIQRHWRSYCDRRRYKQQQSAAAVLQAYIRGWQYRQSPDNPLPNHRHLMQQRLLQQRLQEQVRQQRQAAAVVLQCCIRGWKAHQQLREAQTRAQGKASAEAEAPSAAAAEVAAATGLHVQPAVDLITAAAEPVAARPIGVIADGDDDGNRRNLRPESSSSTSSGGSSTDVTIQQDSSQQAAGVREVHKHRKHQQSEPHRKTSGQQPKDPENCRKQRCDEDLGRQLMPAGQKQDQQNSTRSISCPVRRPGFKDYGAISNNGPLTDVDALLARQLVIRSAAETRTATQHGGTDMSGYRAGLVGDLVQRAEELSAGESLQQASLATRATMAGSSHRGLQEAMTAVKGGREAQ